MEDNNTALTLLAVVGSLLAGLVFYVLGLLPQAAEVAGWGAVVGVLINVAKLFVGEKMDGWAGKISLLANFVLLVILWLADQFQTRDQVEMVIGQMGIALPAIFSLLLAMGAAKLAHKIMAWLDGLSFSFSKQIEVKATDDLLNLLAPERETTPVNPLYRPPAAL